MRVEWISKGKVVANQRCAMNVEGDTGSLECDWKGAPLKAQGDVTVNLIYVDDQTEKEYLLRTMEVKVVPFTWMKERNYQILLDDTLDVAYAWHRFYGGENRNQDNNLYFFFWMANVVTFRDPMLRWSVNGQKVPDFKVSIQTNGYEIEALYHVNGDERRYRWSPMRFYPERLWFGTREEVSKHHRVNDEDIARGEMRILAEMAGDWDCMLRAEGKPIRQFMFKVNDKGRIEPSEAQSALGFPKLPPSVVWVDMRIPAKSEFDLRVRPDAMTKSMPYGMPWPKHPAFDAAKKALPPASGLADPK